MEGIEILIITWCVSFIVGIVAGVILRLSLLFHGMIGAFLLGHSIGQSGIDGQIELIVQGWSIGLFTVLGLFPGYGCGYLVADAACKALESRLS